MKFLLFGILIGNSFAYTLTCEYRYRDQKSLSFSFSFELPEYFDNVLLDIYYWCHFTDNSQNLSQQYIQKASLMSK